MVSDQTHDPLFSVGLSEAQNTVAFWRLFDLQKRKEALQEVKQSLQELHSDQDDTETVHRFAVCFQQKDQQNGKRELTL